MQDAQKVVVSRSEVVHWLDITPVGKTTVVFTSRGWAIVNDVRVKRLNGGLPMF
jgi:hypothetical protein